MFKRNIISSVVLFVLLMGTYADAELIDVVTDKENYTVTVSGCFDNAVEGSYVSMQIAAEDFSSVEGEEWINDKKLLYFLQTQTDENGSYSFDTLNIDADSGNYICTVRNITSDTVQSKEFFMPSSSDLLSFIDAVNKDNYSSVYESLDAEIENKKLGIDVSLYSLLGEDAKKAVIDKLFAASYASVKPLEEDIIKYSCVYGVLKNETYEGALSYFEEPYQGVMEENKSQLVKYLDIENFKNTYSGKRFYEIDHSSRLSVVKTVLDKKPDTTDTFYDYIDIALISNEIENAGGYNEVNTILNSYKDCLDGMDFEYYNDFEKRNSVDKELFSIGSFESKESLYETVDDLIKKYRKNSSSGSSGGGSGGGGGSYGGASNVVVKNDVADKAAADAGKPDTKFIDMNGYEWAEEYVKTLNEKGIVSGKGENLFCPGDKITREEFVTMIVKACGIDMSNSTMSFQDVTAGAWYERYVLAAYENGIVSGVGDGSFGVGKNITRQDMAVIVNNSIKEPLDMGNADFTDFENVAVYARDSIAKMVGAGVLSGYPDGSFAPQKEVTRAEAAVVICKMLAI